MTEPVDLDLRRGMMAQRDTDARRLVLEVAEEARLLRKRQDELEAQLLAAPAAEWREAAAKARYLLELFARSPEALDPRRQALIAKVLEDFERLSREG
jgi:hypothetical protein